MTLGLLLRRYRPLLLYFVIGCSAAAGDLALFYLLHRVGGVHSVVATLVSMGAGAVWAFSLNALFNFKTRDRLFRRFLAYNIVNVAGMALSAAALFVFAETLGLDAMAVKVATLPAVFLVQYTLNRRFTFQRLEGQRLEDAGVMPVRGVWLGD